MNTEAKRIEQLTIDAYEKGFKDAKGDIEEMERITDQLKQRDQTIQELKDTIEKKEVAFKLITGQQHEEIRQLKEALKDVLHHWREGFKPSGHNHVLKCYDDAFKLIDL